MTASTKNYVDRDDAVHHYDTPDYYEWWYNDAHFDNGYSCVIVYHIACGFVRPRFPIITKDIYTPDGEKISSGKVFRPEECSASKEKCDVHLGESFIRQEGDSYRVFAPGKNTAVDLVFKRTVPGWKPGGTGYLYNNHEQVQGWVVPVPRAEVEGTITVKGKQMKVRGLGYHDHNWSNVNMYDSFRHWHWGRLHHPDYTLIYYYLYPFRRNEANVGRFLLARGSKIIMTPSDFKLTAFNDQVDQATGIAVPRNLLIRAKDNENSVKLEVITHDIFDSNKLPQMASWPVYYWRFKAEYNCEVNIMGSVSCLQGQTMSEYMLLRPKS